MFNSIEPPYSYNPTEPFCLILGKRKQNNITEKLEEIFWNGQKHYKHMSLRRDFRKYPHIKLSSILTPKRTFMSISRQNNALFKSS